MKPMHATDPRLKFWIVFALLTIVVVVVGAVLLLDHQEAEGWRQDRLPGAAQYP